MEYDVRDAVETFEVGGFVFFGGGFVKRGVRPNPPNPLWLRACTPCPDVPHQPELFQSWSKTSFY